MINTQELQLTKQEDLQNIVIQAYTLLKRASYQILEPTLFMDITDFLEGLAAKKE